VDQQNSASNIQLVECEAPTVGVELRFSSIHDEEYGGGVREICGDVHERTIERGTPHVDATLAGWIP
jgi:hypothetical protein